MQVLLKIFVNFCVWMLTHNALQHLLFFFFLVLTYFLDELVKVFSRLFNISLLQVRGLKIGLVPLDTSENFCLQILLVFVANACGQHRYKQILKHVRKMYVAMQQATEQDSNMEVKNAVNSQRIIWFMQEIYYE